MSKADDYRAKARLCAERAAVQRDWDIKQLFQELEANWIFLAERSEQQRFFQQPLTRAEQGSTSFRLNRPA
jgi:hypothetical protein